MKVRAFLAPDTSPRYLATAIESWFRNNEFEAQSFEGPGGTYIVQGRKDSLVRFFFGLSAALVVTIGTQEDGALTVTIGAGSWTDKLLAGLAGAILFAPLAFTAVYGLWRQNGLEEQLWEHIALRLPQAKEVPVLVAEPPFHPVNLVP